MSDERVIQSTVVSVLHSIDGRRWADLRALFADTVETDYTSLFGGEVQKQNADDLVAGWKTILTPLAATQHMLGPIDVRVRGESGTAECHVRGYHYLKGAPGGDEWMVAGHYVFELASTAAGWKVQKLTLQTFHQSGNTKLLQEAAAR